MVAMASKIQKSVVRAILLGAAATLMSCASQQQVALVDDPDSKHESMIPWNKQEKWESGGQFAGMTDRR
jgi:hypothetical protein